MNSSPLQHKHSPAKAIVDHLVTVYPGHVYNIQGTVQGTEVQVVVPAPESRPMCSISTQLRFLLDVINDFIVNKD